MIIFTSWKKRTDKFLKNSLGKGKIIIANRGPVVEGGTLFLFDDISPLGIKYPQELVEVLEQNNSPTRIFNAQELAESIVERIPVKENIVLMSGGGVLSYLFLSRAGYEGVAKGIINIERTYQNGKPFCELISKPEFNPDLIIEDIIASGQTLTTVNSSVESNSLEMACLLASSNIPQGIKGYRNRKGSTLEGISKLYCAQLVNGLNGVMKPAILSLRYLITKALDDEDYSNNYLARKFGGLEEASKICELVGKVDRQQIDLLRKDPISFLRDYGLEVRT